MSTKIGDGAPNMPAKSAPLYKFKRAWTAANYLSNRRATAQTLFAQAAKLTTQAEQIIEECHALEREVEEWQEVEQ